jgi:hypothetical protein
MTQARRFPPPWSAEDIGAAFVVKDGAGRKLAYVYFDDPRFGGQAAHERREARRIAVNIAKLSELLRQVIGS